MRLNLSILIAACLAGIRNSYWLVSTVCLLGLAMAFNSAQAEPSALQPVAPSPNEAYFGAHMQRTMSLLATSNPERHNPVHIVIYGQSITGGNWWHAFVNDLKIRYPNADLIVENLSIGGIGTETLIRTAIFDVYPNYPDLIIFQAYGGESGELDQLIANIRRYTTADVVMFTHHIMSLANMPGDDWEHAGHTISQDHMADVIRFVAQKYGCELVEVREEWKQYLKQYGLHARELVTGDGVHPNVVGDDLLAVLVGRHFRFNPIISNPWADRVRSYQLINPLYEGVKDEITFQGTPWKLDGLLGIGASPKDRLKLTFEGNRIDIITAPVTDKKLKLGTAKILIDGKSPSANPQLYVFTRPDATPGSWFPAVLYLNHNTVLIPETWTMRITGISKDGKNVAFDISGSVTGPDGSGTNAARFVSKSGRIVIEPKDLERIGWSHVNMAPCPIGHEFKWKVIPQFLDTYTPPAATDNSRVYAVTVAQGLVNTRHTLEIIPNGDGAVPIQSIQIFCPPLK